MRTDFTHFNLIIINIFCYIIQGGYKLADGGTSNFLVETYEDNVLTTMQFSNNQTFSIIFPSVHTGTQRQNTECFNDCQPQHTMKSVRPNCL